MYIKIMNVEYAYMCLQILYDMVYVCKKITVSLHVFYCKP